MNKYNKPITALVIEALRWLARRHELKVSVKTGLDYIVHRNTKEKVTMKQYKKLIVGALALGLMALKDFLNLDLPVSADVLYSGIVAILGAFGIYQVSNAD